MNLLQNFRIPHLFSVIQGFTAYIILLCHFDAGNEPYIEMQPSYFPPELAGHVPKNSNILYHCYLMELEQKFDIPLHDIVLVLRNKLESELESLHFDLDVDRGSLPVTFKYVGVLNLSKDQVHLCTRFQKTLLRVLRLKILNERMDGDILGAETDYLLLPATGKHQRERHIVWKIWGDILLREHEVNKREDKVRERERDNSEIQKLQIIVFSLGCHICNNFDLVWINSM